jgi:zinc transport system substrate-binding protein
MHRLSIVIFSVILILASCGKQKEENTDKDIITVSILPQKYFVEQIAGDNFEVNVMIPPGANPVTYDPSPRQMKMLDKSLAYIKIGHLAFEKAWFSKFKSANSNMEIADQSTRVDLIVNDAGHHHHGEDHHEAGVDPHIWTSPKSVKKQIEVIYTLLSNLDPENNLYYRKNTIQFSKKIDSLDSYIENKFSGMERRSFLIFHPALSYYSRDYGLSQIPVEIEGKEPSPIKLRELVDKAKSKNIQRVFIQEQFNTDNARTVAREIGGKAEVIDPLAYDWYQSIKDITDKLAASMKKQQEDEQKNS